MADEFGGFRNLFGKGFQDLYGNPARRVRHHKKIHHHRYIKVKAHHRKVKMHHYPKQTGKRKSLHLDRLHKAKAVGWRKSRSGKKYYESRKNRSDIRGKRI